MKAEQERDERISEIQRLYQSEINNLDRHFELRKRYLERTTASKPVSLPSEDEEMPTECQLCFDEPISIGIILTSANKCF